MGNWEKGKQNFCNAGGGLYEGRMKRTLVILAAGMGSRYGGLKQMEGFGPQGETLLEYSVYDAIRSGFARAVFVIQRKMETAFAETVGRRLEEKIEVALAFQDPELRPEETAQAGCRPEREKPWGTGHALRSALPAVNEPFLVMNADDFYGRGAFEEAAEFLGEASREGGTFGLVGYQLGRTLSPHGQVSRGVLNLSEGMLLRGIEERHQIERKTEGIQYLDTDTNIRYRLGGRALVSMNLLALTPEINPVVEAAWMNFLKEDGGDPKAEFGVPDVMEAAMEAGHRIRVIPTEEGWMGVTHADDAESVRAGLRHRVGEGQYPDPLWGNRH